MTTTYAAPSEDGEDSTCANCADEVIRNYDGLGTGWSHIWPQGHPDYLRSGTKECRTADEVLPEEDPEHASTESPASVLAYRSIRARAYEVLSGGQVVGRVHRTPHTSDVLRWEAYRPGGGSAGTAETRAAAARLLTPISSPRITVDADCPGCGYPERSYDPASSVFGCSSLRPGGRCGYESTERGA